MSTITKEGLEPVIERLEHYATNVKWTNVQAAQDMLIAVDAMRIALASLEADGALANEGTITATQFKPVADLYEVTVPSGRSTTFTKDAAEASDCRVMGWSVQEYVKLERYQVAMLQGAEPVSNRDELPDGWVACSERMPKKGEEVLCTDQFENYETALYDTGYIPGPPFFATTAGEFHPTHWMPLPAAPQQEVK
ncbi:TPA: DUF551 domain-containing protein [Enterobacter cloacae]|nr:DUF551 domain-containing protein [Enterobacter cloacae]